MKPIIIFFTFFSISFGLKAAEKTITTSDGVKLYVKIKGSGTPMLFLHGGPGSGSLWFEKLSGSFMEQHFTVVYLDQRGVGRSGSSADNNYSIDRLSKDFEEVRVALGYEKWVTMGHSFGGILQMGYAERYPKSILGMIMLNCTISLNESACESWLPKAAELVGQQYRCDGDSIPMPQRMNEFGGKLREKNIFWKLGAAGSGTFDSLDKLTAEIENFNYDFNRYALNYPDYWKNFKASTANMRMPVLFFYGKTDYMVGPDHYKTLQFPNTMLWESNGGHVPFIEDKEELEKAIISYIKKYKF